MKTSILISLALLFLAGCGEDTQSTDNVPPQAPIMVERSDDSIYPQAGVRAEPTPDESNYWVRVEWYRNPEPDVVGYRISRWSEQSTSLNATVVGDVAVGVEIPDTEILSWVDRGFDGFGNPTNALAPNDQGSMRGYWWHVLAYDTAGNRGEWSDSVYYRLMWNPYNLSVSQFAADDYRLNWNYPIGGAGTYLSYYKLRVYSEWYGRDSLVWDHQVILYGAQNSVTLGSGGATGTMVNDCTYVWQLNAVSLAASDTHDVALAGASIYTTFVYQE
ncbi:MAG: hypothetical protein H6508_00790 [Calditrichaeota bacterium]|nr:hypothetical protein [Calditrichota bacterium]MCB9365711.1 hypothetical protein [Calditrichota bacterium]